MKPRRSTTLSVLALLAGVLVRLLGRTCRLEIRGREVLEALRDSGRPVLLTFWHRHSASLAYFMLHHVHRAGIPIILLASRSRDGELVTRVGRLWGVKVVRGSASRGGTEALHRLYRAIVRQHLSPITIPDGPRGPIFRCKPGVIALAQMTGAPILPLSCSVSRAWDLNSWDRMLVPKPFARLEIGVGAPLHIPRQLPGDDLERHRQRVENTLNDLFESLRPPADAGAP